MVLENEFTDIGCFLNELILDQDVPSSTERLKLTADVLECVLASMDTEYDRNALKGILFTFSSMVIEGMRPSVKFMINFRQISANFPPIFPNFSEKSFRSSVKFTVKF